MIPWGFFVMIIYLPPTPTDWMRIRPSTPPHMCASYVSRINIQHDPKKMQKNVFCLFFISISPDEVHVKGFLKV